MEINTAYVTTVHRGRYELEAGENRFFGRMKASEFLQPGRKEVFPTVGDRVEVNLREQGDSIITTSGFYGVVIDIQDDVVVVEFGSNKNCRIPMRKTAIQTVEKPDGTTISMER